MSVSPCLSGNLPLSRAGILLSNGVKPFALRMTASLLSRRRFLQTDISVMADVLAAKLFFFQPMKEHNDKLSNLEL